MPPTPTLKNSDFPTKNKNMNTEEIELELEQEMTLLDAADFIREAREELERTSES